MSFLDRFDDIISARACATSTASALLTSQRSYGDFHLKTAAALATHNVLTALEALETKLEVLNFGFAPPIIVTLEAEIGEATADATLDSTTKQIATLCDALIGLREGLTAFVDTNLEYTLDSVIPRLQEDLEVLTTWVESKPTRRDDLRFDSGLLRDCLTYEITHDANAGATQLLRKNDMRDPAVKAIYLNANAYLELTTIDIISDMISESWRLSAPICRPLRRDLNRQLLDETRHAELLAERLDQLGFQLGCAPVSLHTWKIYQSFDTLGEKLLAQQVVQESFGLDASVENILKFYAAGDRATADLYAQITADERNHVQLGMRWANVLADKPFGEMLGDVLRRVRVLDGVEAPAAFIEMHERAVLPLILTESRQIASTDSMNIVRHALGAMSRRQPSDPDLS